MNLKLFSKKKSKHTTRPFKKTSTSMKFCARICLYLCVHTDRYIFACVCVCLCECVLEIVAMTKIIARFVNLSSVHDPSYKKLHPIAHNYTQNVAIC